MNNQFSLSQLSMFRAFRTIQTSGKYNMMMQASTVQRLIGASNDEYLFIIENYEALAQAAGDE